MTSDLIPSDYPAWLTDLKARIQQAQQRATLSVNRELISLYWQLGKDILTRQSNQGWGAKVIERLSRDLRAAFPEMKGFSRANLLYMHAFAEAWPDPAMVQQAVGQLPWGHNIVLLTRHKDELLVEYATYKMDSQLFVQKYQLYLPDREELRRQLERALQQAADQAQKIQPEDNA
jgi:predicted nuclease of restriction endonuclease-like (RecB) superfamily